MDSIHSVRADLRQLQADTLGDNRVCVAVLDGPVDLSHPCFDGANLRRLDTLVQEVPGQGRMSLHGTHVASLIFGQPSTRVAGIAPKCRGLILPVFREDQQQGRVSQLDLARAIEQAVQAGAHIISVSGGEQSPNGQPDEMLNRALKLCEDNGVLVVAAVGNDGCECIQVPAAIPSVLAVGALDDQGEPLRSNNWGSAYESHGVLAPGQDVAGAAPGGGMRSLTGSSFATPIVSGVAALLSSAQIARTGEHNPIAVGKAILETATPCRLPDESECRRYLGGTLSIPAAYSFITKRRTKTVASSDMAPMPSPTVRSTPASETSALDTMEPGVHAAGGEHQLSGPAPADPGTVGASKTDSKPRGSEDLGTEKAAAAASAQGHGVPHLFSPSEVEVRQRVGVLPAAACACETGKEYASGGKNPSYVYAIGTIGFDFGTEARRDGFRQNMDRVTVGNVPPREDPGGEPVFTTASANPYDPNQLSTYLARNPWASDKLIWTLNLDRTPIYALEAEHPVGMTWGEPIVDPAWDTERLEQVAGRPADLAQLLTTVNQFPPVSYVYKTFREAIVGQVLPERDDNFIARVSVPGILTNKTRRLFSGQIVPVVVVAARGMYTWNERALVSSAAEQVERDAAERGAEARMDGDTLRQNIRAFLDKIYYQFRNLGQSSPDRALNFAATNAFLFTEEMRNGLLSARYVPGPNDGLYTLDQISVSKSPYCRMDSDCWDVTVRFFDPNNERRAKVTYLFTIDVSDELPVSLAPSHRFLETS